MSITQVGKATASEDLINHISERTKSDIGTDNLNDYPSYSGQTGRYMTVTGSPGSETMVWNDLPPTGLVWQNQESDTVMVDKIGYITTGGLTLTLPQDPIEGSLVAICDRDRAYSTNPVTVLPSGSDTIDGHSELILDVINTYIQIIYSNGTWNITNVNHPSNISEITEEVFPAGNTEYSLGRIPASRASIMVIYQDKVLTTDQYVVSGNTLTFPIIRTAPISVRYLGLPSVTHVTDTPVGTCLDFYRLPAPDGWIISDGSTIQATEYPELVKYLTKDAYATEAVLPPAQGWKESDTGPSIDIPTVLSDNTWGKWAATSVEQTAQNIWNGNNNSSSSIKFEHGYIGYEFDIPVVVTAMQVHSQENNVANLPSFLALEYSDDNVTWTKVSTDITGGASMNDSLTNIPNTTGVGVEARYWRIKGTGGTSRIDGSGLYWNTKIVTILGSTTRTIVGNPDGVTCIKAFSMQGTPTSNPGTEIAALSVEVQRLKSIVERL